MDKPDLNLTTKELQYLQTISKDDLVWIEIGMTGAGKSTLGNFLLRQEVFKVGQPLLSETYMAQVGCSEVDGQSLCIVDTPGFGDTHIMGKNKEEAENLANAAANLTVELTKTMLMARHGVHTFFVVVAASDKQLTDIKELLDLLNILGNYWNHTILVFTRGWEFHGTSEDKQYEKCEAMLNNPECPEVWKTLIQKVNKRYGIVESKYWKDDREYHARKVKEFKEHSSAIVAAHGPYKDTLHSVVREYIETAKLKLRHEFNDMESPEAEVAALQVAFQNITAMLHKLIKIKRAGGIDTEQLQEMAKAKEQELSKVRSQRDEFYQELLKEQEEKRKAQEQFLKEQEEKRKAQEQFLKEQEEKRKAQKQFLKEQEEKRKAQEAEERARKAQRESEEQANKLREAARNARRRRRRRKCFLGIF